MSKKRPRLILAPMEVLADRQLRAALRGINGMDEAVHEFIRVPERSAPSAIYGSLRRYDAGEMADVPLAAQLMGANPDAMAIATRHVAERGARRVDLNAGCPSPRGNRCGAGAGLLREPGRLFGVCTGMVRAVEGTGVVVSVKMRSGYGDVGLLEENVRAVVEAGVRMITLHPRTRVQGYGGRADWGLIGRVKGLVGDGVEVVGNGDVMCAEDAVRMLEGTGCDHVMVGRGAVANPWIFWEIRERLGAVGMPGKVERCFKTECEFYTRYLNASGGVDGRSSRKVHRMKIGRLKMLVKYTTRICEEDKQRLMHADGDGDARAYLNMVLEAIGKYYGVG